MNTESPVGSRQGDEVSSRSSEPHTFIPGPWRVHTPHPNTTLQERLCAQCHKVRTDDIHV